MTQQKEKRSFRQMLAERIFPTKSPDYKVNTLHKLGIDTLSDQKLENRIALLISLQNEMSKPITTDDNKSYLKILKDRQTKLNTAIYEIAVPYAGAGSNVGYAKMVDGWNTLNSQALSWILMAEDVIQAEEENKKDKTEDSTIPKISLDRGSIDNTMLIRYLHDALLKFIWSDAFAVLAKCFRDQDVSERAAIVIQSLIQPHSQVPRGFEDGLNPTGQ